MPHELEPRQLEILKAIVEDFIAKGDPVGSQQVSRRGELEVSPATIRAVMADLEELGYLEKPHTSAGRIPTDLGYRLFVDTLLQVREPTSRERLAIDTAVVPEATSVDQALDTASRIVHDLSRHASLVMLPKPEQDTFRRVELIRLREDRVLAVLVSQSGTVQNKLLRLEHAMSQDELTRAANYLNEMLERLTLEVARERIAAELTVDSASYDEHKRRALALAQKMMADPSDDSRVLVQGQGSLLEDFSTNVQQARAALRLLEEKKQILQVLDQTRGALEMKIFIGTESGFLDRGLAVVSSPFQADGVMGSLAVIGPTRMDYSRVVSLVNYTARSLTRALAP